MLRSVRILSLDLEVFKSKCDLGTYFIEKTLF